MLYAVVLSALVMFAYSLAQWRQTVPGVRALAEALEDGPIVIGLTLLLLGPLWLLGAAVIAVARIRLRRELPEREKYYRQIGRITVRMILGAVFGIAAMFVIGVLFMGLS
ncbi:MAG: hypothetical protein KDA37_06360 [Planctomycetales bacterium]|nr:hypothetical protein [Planctomycetales bacterium]